MGCGRYNCMVRNRGRRLAEWMPAIRDGEEFYDGAGYMIVTPDEWRAATPEAIAEEMQRDDRCIMRVKAWSP